MNALVILPVIIPLGTAVACLLCLRGQIIRNAVALTGASGLLISAGFLLQAARDKGYLVVHLGGWTAPVGVTFVADLFGAIMVLLAALMGFAVTVYSLSGIDARLKSFGYFPVLFLLLTGVCGAFLTGDLFNLYVWFEVMLIASFVLMSLGGERAQIDGAIKYVTINLISSLFFLSGIGILYGKTGTLNMADLSAKLAAAPQSDLVNSSAMLILVAFGIKAAMFPLFFWLPASYHTPPPAVSAIFAGLLTKVGVYALIRSFTLLFLQDTGFMHTLLLVLSGFTMLSGVLGAASQYGFRRILSFHIISQIGYMTMGLGLFTPQAITGSLFYLIHHIVVKTNLFLMSGVVRAIYGTDELTRLGGLYRHRPLLAVLFAIPALSLAGIPPFSGFFAKLTLIRAGLEAGQGLLVATALVTGLLTMYSMTKIWAAAFWKAAPEGEPLPSGKSRISSTMLLPVGGLALLTIAIGLLAQPIFQLASEAAGQLLNPTDYIQAVLGESQ